jgi:KUP system potassium uptake protein
VITSFIFFEVTRCTWRWPAWKSVPLLLLFLSFDIPFFGANLFKFVDGGYVPVLLAAVLTVIMITWNRGRRIYGERVDSIAPSVGTFLADLPSKLVGRIPGCAIFLTGRLTGIPLSLVHYVQRIRVLPEHVMLLTLDVVHVPHASDDAMTLQTLGDGLVHLVIERGFMDGVELVPLLERAIARFKLPLDLRVASYCLGRETFLATSAGSMGKWSETLFAFLARNARTATTHFHIPTEQVIEIGLQIDL